MEVKALLGEDFKIENNTTTIKQLLKYGKTDEFKGIIEYSDKRKEELIKANKEFISNRDRVELIGSYIDDKTKQIEVLDEIIEMVSNKVFANYLKERRNRYESYINYSDTKEEVFSSQVDLNKIQILEYNGIKSYLAYCIDLLNKGKEKDYYKGLNPYE